MNNGAVKLSEEAKSDFDAVQRVLTMDTRTPPNCDKVHIFSGLLICGCCGGRMARKTAKHVGKRYIYYSCTSCKQSRTDSTRAISENDLLRIVESKIKERIRNIESLLNSFSEEEILTIARTSHAEQISFYSQAVQDMQTFRIHLHGSLAGNLINASESKAFQKHYDEELSRLEAEISTLQKRICSAEESLITELNWADIFRQHKDVESFDRAAVVKMVRKIIIANNHEVTVEFVCQQEYERLVRFSKIKR